MKKSEILFEIIHGKKTHLKIDDASEGMATIHEKHIWIKQLETHG